MEIIPAPLGVIVAADDDEDDIDLMRLLFRKAGVSHPFHFYDRGEEIVDALTEWMKKAMEALPFLCFLDVKMPGLGGFEVLRWIRRQPALDAMSVVMLSSSEHPADVKRAASEGAQCYLAKYPQPAVLRSVVEEAERHRGTAAKGEWFGLPANLLLRWGLING